MDINTLIGKIREEASRRRRDDSTPFVLGESERLVPGEDSPDGATNMPLLRSLILSAEAHADVGTDIPPMLRFHGLMRRLAIMAGRTILYLSSFMTEKQRAFNTSVIGALKVLTDGFERLKIDESHLLLRDLKLRADGCRGELENLRNEQAAQLSALRTEHSIVGDLALQVERQKLDLLDQQRRLAILEGTRKRSTDPQHMNQTEKIMKEENRHLDVLNVAFTERFRGTRQEIRERQKIYLPYVKEIVQKTNAFPLLDLGCGRGEWLELLNKVGYSARGIDNSWIMVQLCRERGLDVVEADIIEHLEDQDASSVSVITGFHLLEHLPFRTQLRVLGESLRVLTAGGLAIFETPNPANILVSAYDFLRDPTHLKPIHPDTLTFAAEHMGFVRVGSYFIDEKSQDRRLIRVEQWKFDDVCDYVSVSRDFVFLGYKDT